MKKVVIITILAHLWFSVMGLLFPASEDYNYYLWKLIVSQVYAIPGSVMVFILFYTRRNGEQMKK